MFSKPASFKPSAAIKNSERKNIIARIEKQCSLEETSPEQKQLLVPKSVQAANALTHGGEKVVIYSDEQLPLWVLIRTQYVPTVALINRLPVEFQLELLPIVHTVPRTLQYLQNGADFMTPGIFGDLPSSNVKPGTPVQIRDLESQSVMATGLALRDLSQITEQDTGKCVQTVSVVGDKLTPDTKLGKPVTGEPAKPKDEETKAEPEPNSEPAAKTSEEPHVDAAVGNLKLAESDDESENLAPKEVDEAFMYALNKVIRQKKHTYPMTMAAFAALLGDNLPYEHSQLNIKNTTFKKMGKLLKNAEKLGLINCRDRQGGEVIVMGVNVPQNEMEPEPVVRKSKKNTGNSANRMAALVAYKPKPSLREIMDSESSKVELHDAGSLRNQVLKYVSDQNLLNENKEVNLDEPLRKALGQRQTVSSVKREAIGTLVVSQCSPFYKIVAPDQSPDAVKWSKGGVPTIVIKTERRGGNKVVTLVQTAGLAGFKIDPQELADELRHVCAGSSTVTDVKGSNCIVVQGNHVAKIVKVLEKRGIKPAWVKTS